MSMRSTGRLARPLRAAPRYAALRSLTLPRRTASSHSSKPKSDMPWMLGSAVVFIPLTAWVAMYDTTGHTVNDHTSGSGKDLPFDQYGNKGAETMYHLGDQADDGEKEEGDEAGEEKEGGEKKEGDEGKEGGEEKEGDEGKEGGEEKEQGGEEAGDKGEGAGGVLPSKEEVKSSIKQAVQSNIPRIAMDQEEKGTDTQAQTGGQAKKGGEEEKAPEDDGAHPSDKDIRASIVQSMKSNAPEVAFADDTDKGNERLA